MNKYTTEVNMMEFVRKISEALRYTNLHLNTFKKQHHPTARASLDNDDRPYMFELSFQNSALVNVFIIRIAEMCGRHFNFIFV